MLHHSSQRRHSLVLWTATTSASHFPLFSSKLKLFYLQPCLLDSPWQRNSVNELLTRRGKTPGSRAARCLTLWMSSASVCGHFPFHDGCFVWICVATPEARAWQGRKHGGPRSHSQTNTHWRLFPPPLWQRVIGRSDVMEGVKAQRSDSDSLRRTPLLSFPVVVKTCWDFLSNKARTHQSVLADVPTAETTHLIHRSTWVHTVVQKILPREQLLGLNTAVSHCFLQRTLNF